MALFPPLQTVSNWILGILVGTPFGNVQPPPLAPTPQTFDGRTAGLRILARYISELTFYRTGDLRSTATATTDDVYGPPIPFQIAFDDIHIEQPDNEKRDNMPSLGVIAGRGEYEAIGLTTFVIEETKDVYGKGTVLQWSSEYNETFQLQIEGGTQAERRAMIVGLEKALVPTEQLFGIRFEMPAYFGQLVCFSLEGRQLDESEAGRNRRRAQLSINMRYTVCALVPYVILTPYIKTTVTDDPTVDVDVEVPP